MSGETRMERDANRRIIEKTRAIIEARIGVMPRNARVCALEGDREWGEPYNRVPYRQRLCPCAAICVQLVKDYPHYPVLCEVSDAEAGINTEALPHVGWADKHITRLLAAGDSAEMARGEAA